MAPSGIQWRMGAKGLAYYNEFDRDAANWLRELIGEGLIAPGIVDDRSIEDVRPTDLLGFTQCHFFAGVGGWSYALRLAGWPDDRPVWTGSCPCQPFSQAGKGEGFADERHLWPAFDWLIGQCRPATVVGEQVAGKPGLAWLDLVSTDLEAKGYAVGAADLCAAGVGAPHIRQRLFWVANRPGTGLEGIGRGRDSRPWWQGTAAERSGKDGGLANDAGSGRGIIGRRGGAGAQDAGAHADLDHEGHRPGPVNGQWADADWLFCRDGKWRPVESGTFPLGHGLPARVGRLRGYGNAIVPQVAAAFVRAYLGVIGG